MEYQVLIWEWCRSRGHSTCTELLAWEEGEHHLYGTSDWSSQRVLFRGWGDSSVTYRPALALRHGTRHAQVEPVDCTANQADMIEVVRLAQAGSFADGTYIGHHTIIR